MIISPIFVVGCPRSGTTLVSQLLQHTQYGTPVETHFITKYYKILNKYGDLNQKNNFKKMMRDILKERPIMQWKLSIDLDDFWENLNTFEYAEIIHNLCMLRFSQKGAKSWGDKTPHYILDLDIIDKLFPTSKYIYIVRDGRDVALSLLKVPWGPQNLYASAEHWKNYNKDTPTLKKIRNDKRVYMVKYENLLDNPDRIINELFEFVKVDISSIKKKKLISSIHRSNHSKWRTSMTKAHVKQFEEIAFNTLNRFGYETSFLEARKRIPRMFWMTHNRFFQLLHLIKINTVDTILIKYFNKDPFAD